MKQRRDMFTEEELIPVNARVNCVICYQKCKQGFIRNSVEEGNKLSMHTQQEPALKDFFSFHMMKRGSIKYYERRMTQGKTEGRNVQNRQF